MYYNKKSAIKNDWRYDMQPIEFPGLGLKFTIDPVAFRFLGISVHWYGIIIAFGFVLSIFLAAKDSKKYNINKNDIFDLILFVLPLSIIGARLYYVIFSFGNYINNPIEIFMIWHGGLAIYGGIFTAIIVAYFFAKKRKIGILKLFDFLIPYLALGQAIGRWGNFVNQEAYGTQTRLPWRMEIYDVMIGQRIAVHPTFLYESLWNFVLFAFLIWFRKRKKLEGEVMALYLALYGFARLFIEGLRTDSLYFASFRISQILAGLFFIVFSLIFIYRRIKLHMKELMAK